MDILNYLQREIWIILALISIALQVRNMHTAIYTTLAIAAGFVFILVEYQDIPTDDFLLQIIIFLMAFGVVYHFFSDKMLRLFQKRGSKKHDPAGDFAKVYSASLDKNNIGKILWRTHEKKAILDDDDPNDKIYKGQQVVIIKYVDNVYHVSSVDLAKEYTESHSKIKSFLRQEQAKAALEKRKQEALNENM